MPGYTRLLSHASMDPPGEVKPCNAAQLVAAAATLKTLLATEVYDDIQPAEELDGGSCAFAYPISTSFQAHLSAASTIRRARR